MHDPMTVAFEIRRPWPTRSRLFSSRRHWPPWVTIWHVDPERGGSDDSCDWFGSRRTREDGWWPADLDGLTRLSPAAREAVDFVWFHWRAKLGRPWWRHPKWHLHHWSIQVHPWQAFRRWLFTRCAECGQRMPWGYSPVTDHWDAPRHRWWRTEVGVYHHDCHARVAYKVAAKSSGALLDG